MIDKVVLLDKAITLAEVYGNNLETVVYTQGCGLSARLRLEKIGYNTEGKSFASKTYEHLVDSRIDNESVNWRNDNRAGLIWLDDLYELTSDKNIIKPIIDQADLFLHNSILDPNIQVEDQFFVSAIMGRAYKYTEDLRYIDFMVDHVLNSPLMRNDGIYIHSKIAEYPWGRGNGFAAYGGIEAIIYTPNDYYRKNELVKMHKTHIDALINLQTKNGAWRQVIDNENSYEELTVTCMIGYALANGIKLGILSDKYMSALEKAWQFVDSRIEDTGIVHDSCTGTGSLDSLNAYLIRKRENGFDNRGGSLSAWFLVDLYKLLG
jgi:rhamnogalacturonyl hydrolase YesR